MKASILSLRPGNVLRSVALVAACLAYSSAPALAQFRATEPSAWPDFDNRAPAAPKAQRSSERQVGQSRLAGQLPWAIVDFDPLLDAPSFIRSRDGFLTGPNGQGRAVSSLTAKAIPAGEPYQPIKAFLNEHSSLFGDGAGILDTARIKRDYVDAHNGLRTVVWEQQFEGIPVFQSVLVGHITKKGELTSLSSRFLPDLAAAADYGTPARVGIQSAPPISASQALLLAGQNIGAGLSPDRVVAAGGPVEGYLLYRTPEQASVRLVWLPLHRSALRLAWEVLVTKPANQESFQLVIDAQTGQVHLRQNLTCHISDATYSVYDSYSPSPFGPSLQIPGNFQPPISNRVTIVTSALDPIASPAGWIPDGTNITIGNNMDAFVDRNFDGQPDQPRPQGTNRVFTFPLDLTLDPTNYIDASTVQLFWRGNWYHDRLYQLGFTEAAGNYQDNNFGRGGVGNDRIIGYVQAGADLGVANNSMFAPAPDGQNGRCYMFIFNFPSPYRDGSLDQEVVIHEFTHGTSWRLVGGGMALGSLQGNGMGEGWSDFYSEALLNPTNASPDAAYASGGYVTYLFYGLDQNYYYGIRRYPYSTDVSKNPLTFKDIDPTQALAHKGVPLSPLFSPFDPRSADEVHNQGEVWCVTLWEMHANLVHKYGWAIGNELTLQLATDGMKLTPGLPNFLQARDAILLADAIDNGGANANEIWNAFAKRGMGYSATSPDGSTTVGLHEAYDVPVVSSVKVLLANYQISGGNGNGVIDFNECNNLNLVLTNFGKTSLTGVKATLSTTTPNAAVAQAVVSYPDLPAGATGMNSVPFKISTSPAFVCGTPIEFTLVINCDQGLGAVQFALPTGVPGAPLQFNNDFLVPIPSPGSNSSAVVVSGVNSAVNKVTVSMFVEETYDYYLTLELIAPDGTTNLLSANNGSLTSNYGLGCNPESQRTTFDDAASESVTTGVPPFAGSFKPQQPLLVFSGKSGAQVNGIWQLRATDQGQFNVGAIHCWSLFITPAICTDGGGQCPGADMALGMSALPNPMIAGNNLNYSIVVTNLGPSIATNVIVTHLLPANVTLVSASSSQGTFSQQGSVVSFSLGSMVPRGTATMTVVVLPTAEGIVYSTATVSSEQPDFVPDNNSVTVATPVRPATSDLVMGITAVPNPVLNGGTLTYTVSLANNGPSPATAVTVTNALPFSAPIKSVTVSQGTTAIFGSVVLWSVDRLAMGSAATATITVTPSTEGLITATATASGKEFDPVTANNTAKITTTVGPAADLVLSLTGFPDAVVTGSNVTYTVIVTNQGPSTATGVNVNDQLPASLTVLSTLTTQGTISISNHIVSCALGALTNGARATITIVAAATTNGTFTSTASVTAAQPDANPANNNATATTTVSAPFVNILPAGAILTYESGPINGAIDIGETVTVTLRLRNSGNSSTRNLMATLLAGNGVAPVPPNTPKAYGVLDPSGQVGTNSFTFTASGTNGATINATLQLQDGTSTYPVVSFPFTLPTSKVFGSTHTIVIPNPTAPNPPWPQESGAADPYPSVINVSNFVGLLGKVTVTFSNLSHSFPGDINALLVAPGGAKTLLMSHAGDKPVVGVDLIFDDSASGPLPATGVLSPGTWRPTAYSPDPQLGGFPPNAPAGPYPAQLAAFNGINPNGAWSLYVFDDHSGDAGGITNGWSLALTAISPVNQVADLGLTAVAKPNSALAGATVTYVFTVTNAGPNTANSVSFTNFLPAGVTLVSSSPSQGTVLTTPTSVIASLGTLSFGGIATVTNVVALTAAPIPPGSVTATLTNTANVAADEGDLNPVNNVVVAVITIGRPVAELSLAQAVAPDPVAVGFSLTNTVTILNHGPGAAVNAILTQPLPLGVGFVAGSSTTTAGTITHTASSITCLLGNLESNATATVTIVLTNSAPGLMTNTVTLGSDSIDPNPTNNSATYVATVISQSPQIVDAGAVLTYESGPINGAIDPGETVTLSLALANIGSLDTVNLQATLLPSGGVTSPSGPQVYGALVHGGPAAARSFTFTSAAVPGAATVATLQLQDGTSTYPPVTFTFPSLATTRVSSSTAVAIPSQGTAMPYPATINVTGLTGRVSKATVTLKGLAHSFPHDIDMLLVSPSGASVLVMSHTGGGHAVTNVNLTFDDDATATLPNYDSITSGTYKPSNYEGPVTLPGTAPSKSYQFALSAFNWSNPNGTWSLYVFDDTTADGGVIAQGWSLDLTTLVTVGPVMDLAVSTAVPATLYVGNALTNTITITNLGPDFATGILLTNTVPAGVTFVSATLSQGSLTGVGGGQITCNLGSLAGGGYATVSIVTVPFVTGSLVNAVTVAGSEEDLNLANNSAQAKTSVSSSLPASVSGSFSDGYFQLTVTGQPNTVYVIQASTDLTSWVPLSTNSSPSGTFTFTDTTAPAPQQRFYRTMRQ